MIRGRRTPRLYIRIGCLVLAVLLVCPIPLWVYHSKILAQTSPFVFICTLLAGVSLGAGAIIGLAVSIIAMFRKRWFCHFICPAGLILEGASYIGLGKTSWWKGCPSIGKYILLITVAGSVAGYPLLLWMDPLVFFTSVFSAFSSDNLLRGILAAAGIILLLITALTSGSLWCARICPLGATQDYLAGIGSLYNKNKTTEITKNSSEKAGVKDTLPVTRRTVLSLASGAALGLWVKKVGRVKAESGLLRPPGAIEENVFTGQCVRCGNCMRACPSKIIQPDIGAAGISGFMAPAVGFKSGYCLEHCNECTKVCPSGAIQKLDLDKKQKYVIGEAVLNASLCYMVRGVNDCDICVRSCPFEAVQVYWDEESYVAFPFVDKLKCNGCGACERFCPTGNVKAITVKRTESIKI